MNLYEKIQEARVRLQAENIKMTGKNTYAGYEYFELDDFIKPLNKIMADLKMTAIPSFSNESATLTVIDALNPKDFFVISSPMGTAQLKGCHEVQNIGAVETYQRRYLYQALFDIAESDGLNKTQGKPTPSQTSVSVPKKAETNKIDKDIVKDEKGGELPFKDVERISNEDVVKDALKGTQWTIDVVERSAMKNYGRTISELNAQQLKALVLRIEGAKNNG